MGLLEIGALVLLVVFFFLGSFSGGSAPDGERSGVSRGSRRALALALIAPASPPGRPVPRSRASTTPAKPRCRPPAGCGCRSTSPPVQHLASGAADLHVFSPAGEELPASGSSPPRPGPRGAGRSRSAWSRYRGDDGWELSVDVGADLAPRTSGSS